MGLKQTVSCTLTTPNATEFCDERRTVNPWQVCGHWVKTACLLLGSRRWR